MSLVSNTFSPSDLFRLSVEQYHELIDSGTLASDEPVELIEGILFRKMSKNPPHSNCNGRVQQVIGSAIGPGWCFRLQEPVTLSDGEPEPDGAVARGTIDDYASKHPGPADLTLVIEIADTSLDRDRGIKLRSYARAGIRCYWIINLIDRQIEVYTQALSDAPELIKDDLTTADSILLEPSFSTPKIFKAGDSIPLYLADRIVAQIPVSDLLPSGSSL